MVGEVNIKNDVRRILLNSSLPDAEKKRIADAIVEAIKTYHQMNHQK